MFFISITKTTPHRASRKKLKSIPLFRETGDINSSPRPIIRYPFNKIVATVHVVALWLLDLPSFHRIKSRENQPFQRHSADDQHSHGPPQTILYYKLGGANAWTAVRIWTPLRHIKRQDAGEPLIQVENDINNQQHIFSGRALCEWHKNNPLLYLMKRTRMLSMLHTISPPNRAQRAFNSHLYSETVECPIYGIAEPKYELIRKIISEGLQTKE